MSADDSTLLVISGPGLPDYAARGMTQTLEPIDIASRIEETINGEAVDFSAPQFRKFKSTITGKDVEPPAFDSLWPGDHLWVQCAKERGVKTGDTPDRPRVPGSERVVGGYTYYRPWLLFAVVSYTDSFDEYEHITTWQLDLIEVSATYTIAMDGSPTLTT